jgi:outer membrane protein TolC
LPELSHSLAADEQKAVTQHPLVMAAEQSVAANRHAAELATAEDLPDWSWEVMVGQRQGSRADMVSLQFTVGLPWQKQLRQRHQQAAALANTQQAEFLAEDQQRALRSEWAEAQTDYATAEAREQVHIQQLIPATTAALATAQAAYQVGKTPLSSLWQARRAVLEVGLEHWLIRIDRLRALVRLQYVVGNEGVMQ